MVNIERHQRVYNAYFHQYGEWRVYSVPDRDEVTLYCTKQGEYFFERKVSGLEIAHNELVLLDKAYEIAAQIKEMLGQ